MDPLIPPIPAAELVPQQGKMVLLRNAIAGGTNSTLCDADLRADGLFSRQGKVPSWVGLELLAQAVAAHAGLAARREGKSPEIGFLIGARSAEFSAPFFPSGRILHVMAEKLWGDEELFSFDGTVRDAATDEVLARARLNFFRPRDLKSFSHSTRGNAP